VPFPPAVLLKLVPVVSVVQSSMPPCWKLTVETPKCNQRLAYRQPFSGVTHRFSIQIRRIIAVFSKRVYQVSDEHSTATLHPAEFTPIPYRIRIGVVGHRKIPDTAAPEPLIREAIDTVLESLFSPKSRQRLDRVRRQGNTPIRYSVITPLAEG